MGFISNLFGDRKHDETQVEINSQLSDSTLRPSLPTFKTENLLELLKVGGVHVALLVDAPPFIGENYGQKVIPVCLLAVNNDGTSICSYTAQSLSPPKPPTLVVWQTNAKYRVYDNPFEEPIDPMYFLQTYLPHLLKELGMEGNVEITRMIPRHAQGV